MNAPFNLPEIAFEHGFIRCVAAHRVTGGGGCIAPAPITADCAGRRG
ncbi:hypothetical protein [Streptomyces sp. P17]|nr:hypothetical protein [Streptomyces sp. P17]MDT9702672.1 hypothetical protein [Streptomyces sp. P17]